MFDAKFQCRNRFSEENLRFADSCNILLLLLVCVCVSLAIAFACQHTLPPERIWFVYTWRRRQTWVFLSQTIFGCSSMRECFQRRVKCIWLIYIYIYIYYCFIEGITYDNQTYSWMLRRQANISSMIRLAHPPVSDWMTIYIWARGTVPYRTHTAKSIGKPSAFPRYPNQPRCLSIVAFWWTHMVYRVYLNNDYFCLCLRFVGTGIGIVIYLYLVSSGCVFV